MPSEPKWSKAKKRRSPTVAFSHSRSWSCGNCSRTSRMYRRWLASTDMRWKTVLRVFSSREITPMLSCVFFRTWCIISRITLDLPVPVPAVRVISSPVRIPYSRLFSPSKGYIQVSVCSSLYRLSPMSARLTIPAGVYGCAFHQSRVNSSRLFCIRYSLASFRTRFTTLQRLGSNTSATAEAASRPALSESKHRTTVSNELRYSKFAFTSLTAPWAPVLIETQGHLLPVNSKADMASSSPSQMVMYLPPGANSC